MPYIPLDVDISLSLTFPESFPPDWVNHEIFDDRLPQDIKDQHTLTKLGRLYRSGYTRIETFMQDLYVFHTQTGRYGIYVEPTLLQRFCDDNNLTMVLREPQDEQPTTVIALPDLVLHYNVR